MPEIAPHDILDRIKSDLSSPLNLGEVDEMIGELVRKHTRVVAAYQATLDHAEQLSDLVADLRLQLTDKTAKINELTATSHDK